MSAEKPKPNESPPKEDAGKVFLEEVTQGPDPPVRRAGGESMQIDARSSPGDFHRPGAGRGVHRSDHPAVLRSLAGLHWEGMKVAWETVSGGLRRTVCRCFWQPPRDGGPLLPAAIRKPFARLFIRSLKAWSLPLLIFSAVCPLHWASGSACSISALKVRSLWGRSLPPLWAIR